MAFNFKVITETASGAIKKWHHQYGFRSYKLADGTDSGEISKKLRDLKHPTKAQVDKIIGSNTWTNLWCTSCGEYKPKLAVFGYDYTSEVCGDCLREASLRLSKLRVSK